MRSEIAARKRDRLRGETENAPRPPTPAGVRRYAPPAGPKG